MTAILAGLATFVDDSFEALMRPSARTMLDPAEIARLSAEGAAMTLDEAVAYALAEPDVRGTGASAG